MNHETMTLMDAKASLRIMTCNQTEILKLLKSDRDELASTKRELQDLTNQHMVALTKVAEAEREASRMLDMKQKAEAEREAINKESRMALANLEEARQRVHVELHQLQQQHQQTLERQAQSRKEMENEMVQLLQQVDVERRKVMQLSLEKNQQDMAFMTLQQRFAALERIVTRLPTEAPANHQPPPSR
jgi:chromosome segregation ATPase